MGESQLYLVYNSHDRISSAMRTPQDYRSTCASSFLSQTRFLVLFVKRGSSELRKRRVEVLPSPELQWRFRTQELACSCKHFVDRWTLTKLRSYFLFFRLPKNVFTHKRVFLWWQSPWAVFQSGTPIVTNWQRCKWCYCRLLAHTQHCSDTLFEMDFSRPVTTKNVLELHPNTKTSFWGKSNVFDVSFASRLQ